MNVCVVAAVEQELGLLMAATQATPVGTVSQCALYSGVLMGAPVYLGVVGIGVVSAALNLGGMLTSIQADRAVMIGSAGALPGSGLEIGEAAVALSEAFAEMGLCSGPGIGSAARLGLSQLRQEIPMDESMARDLMDSGQGTIGLPAGKFLTVAGVSAELAQAEARANEFGAVAENMEGFALALAGMRLGIPVGSVRAISNMAGDRDKSAWRLDLANEMSQRIALNYLRRIL